MKRNFNREYSDNSRKYHYDFDFDVMHPFMLRSFSPFFKGKKVLELGSFEGAFTKRLLGLFDEIVCVEASDEAIKVAQKNLPKGVKFINSTFEDLSMNVKFDNIIMTHVLEHIDNPVAVLRRIRQEWLTESGNLFLVCPNANAPSRQIAVHMGLISHNNAVTEAEAEHGHRITYTNDTLARDIKMGGLKVKHQTGIFFKALANFQWDMAIEQQIVSKDYLEGCYTLGHVYPDLCASLFFLCGK
jgi:2-polyprenyl-3-methyl-5-hydroxy-6-metoxy-1,4-benzoquinol methylase